MGWVQALVRAKIESFDFPQYVTMIDFEEWIEIW
jgi:hypothetical protein